MANKNDQNREEDFPGYPHYPAKEDIMNSRDMDRIDLDVEDISRSKGILPELSPKSSHRLQSSNDDNVVDDDDDDLGEDKETGDSDITREDLIALGEDEATLPPVENTVGNDLDVPGTEDDDANEEIGEEDEENNYYSLGGDSHEDLSEDKGGEG